MAPASAASEFGRVRRDGVTSSAPAALLGERGELGAKRGSDFGRKAEGLALAAEQDGDAGMREGASRAARSASASSARRLAGDAVHGAEGDDHVRPLEFVVNRRGDEVEQPGGDLRVLDVEGEGVRMRRAA